MRPHLLLALFAYCTYTSIAFAQEDAMSHLFRQNVYTPVPDHRTDVVPGMLLLVNYRDGTYELDDPSEDVGALPLVSYTAQLNRVTRVVIQSGGLATTGLKVLIGFDPSISFQNNSTFTFSGVHFNMARLNTADATRIAEQPGPTLTAARADYMRGATDVFLVTDVGATDSATVTSNTEFSLQAGTAPADLRRCTTAPPSNAPPSTPDKSPTETNPPTTTTPFITTRSSTAPSSNTTHTKAKTVSDMQGEQKAVGDKAKADAPSGSTLGGNLNYCKGINGSVIFTNPTPVPTVLKVKRIIFPAPPRPAVLRTGDFAVPLNDIRLCRHVFEGHDSCYNVPRQ